MIDYAKEYAKDVKAKRILAGPHVRAACARHLKDLKTGKERGLFYDIERANRIIEFSQEVCCLNGGDFEGVPFDPLPWQKFILCSLFGWVKEDGTRRFRVCYIETSKGPLALDTPIATPGGWSTMGNLQVGGYVFDDQGRPTKIIEVSNIFYDRDCYEMEFSDGHKIVCDAAHRWNTAAQRNGQKPGPRKDKNKSGLYFKRTTQEIFETLKVKESISLHPQAKWNHRVEVAPALSLPSIILPIPPYTLGAWLGDGDSDCARITNAYADYQIIEEIISDGISAKERCKYSDTTARYILGSNGRSQKGRNDSLQSKLRYENLLGNKHIPVEYFRAETDQRLSLLQGLMDTDGCITKNGNCEITLTNERLCNDVLELIRGLGFKAVIRESDAKLNGKIVGRRWRIGFKAFCSMPVFRLFRKVENLRAVTTSRPLSQGRMIIGCAPVKSVPVRCIKVEAESHQFLAGEGLIPTCNSGKSPLAALIGMYGLVADNEPRAEVYAAATRKEQAQVLFRDAVAMRNQSPELKQRLVTSGTGSGVWNLAYLEAGSFFRPIASDSAQSGPRPHIVLLDEIHEHRNSNVIEMMRAGTKGRRQALIFMITNSGYDINSVCWNYHSYATKVAHGQLLDDAFFSYVCALDKNEDPFKSEKCWIKTNPSLGVTIQPDYIREQVTQAKGMPSKESIVRRLNFSQWVGAESPWISSDVWFAASDTYDIEFLRGRRCWGGLDLSSTQDLTSLVLAFEPTETDRFWRLLPFFWLPEDGLERKCEMDGVDYLTWVRDGHLETTPGAAIDKAHIVHRLVEIDSMFDLAMVAYDRWRIEDLKQQLQNESIDIELAPFGQGFKDMGAAVDDFETLLLSKTIKHNSNPCLTWNAANVVLLSDPAGSRKPAKNKSTGRIDGIIASIMAISQAKKEPLGVNLDEFIKNIMVG